MKEQQDIKTFELNIQQVRKLNNLLPKGYKLISPQQHKKRALVKSKKKSLMGLPYTPQLITTTINLSQPPILPSQSISRTKPNKLPSFGSYQSLPQVILPMSRSYQKIPINLDYYQKGTVGTISVWNKLKNYPPIAILDAVKTQGTSLSWKDIQRKVHQEKDNYKVNQLVNDIRKLCLKIYQSYSKQAQQYQTTVSIQKYLRSLTKVQKPEVIMAPSISPRILPPAPLLKKKPITSRVSQLPSSITIKQKRQLGQRIKKLPSSSLQQICYILFQNLQNKQYSFDLDTLHVKKIRQLQEYVSTHMDMSYRDEGDEIEDQGEESSFIIETDDMGLQA